MRAVRAAVGATDLVGPDRDRRDGGADRAGAGVEPVAARPASTPANRARTLPGKELADRYRDIAEARIEIGRVLADPAGTTVTPVSPAPKRSTTPALTAVAAVAEWSSAGAVAWYLRPADPRPLARFDTDVPPLRTPTGPGFPDYPLVAVSRDGTKWAVSSGTQIYLRHLGEAEARPIQGPQRHLCSRQRSRPMGSGWPTSSSRVSPRTAVRFGRYRLAGGAKTLAPVTGVFSNATALNVDLTWDDQNMLTWVRPQGIMQVSANGGEPAPVAAHPPAKR